LRGKLGALPPGPAALLPRTRLATAYGTARTHTVFCGNGYGNGYGSRYGYGNGYVTTETGQKSPEPIFGREQLRIAARLAIFRLLWQHGRSVCRVVVAARRGIWNVELNFQQKYFYFFISAISQCLFGSVTMTIEFPNMSRMNLSGYVGHVTIFS